MIEYINDSKKAVVIWTVVFLVLFSGLSACFITLNGRAPESERESIALLLGMAYVLSCLPIGWAVRRKVIKWYVHVPTEKIKVFETNLLLALWRIWVAWILAALDLCLLIIYAVASLIVGPFVNLYAIISGVVFMVQKKI